MQNENFHGFFLPNFKAVEEEDPVSKAFADTKLEFIDHIVGNQDWGQMLDVEKW